MKLYEVENNEAWSEEGTGNCEQRFVAQSLQNFPPRSGAPIPGNRSSLCLCVRHSKTVAAQRRCERGQQLFEQLLCTSRKRARLLVPDLATEWFRKQKQFLDKVSPEERKQSQLDCNCAEFTAADSCDCTRCGCYEPRRQSRVQYLNCTQELRRRRMLLAHQRQQLRLGAPICKCTDPENWVPGAGIRKQEKYKNTVRKLDNHNNTSTTWIEDKDKEQRETNEEEQQQVENQSKPEHNPITICQPHVAGCVPGIAEKPKMEDTSQQNPRSIAGAHKLECCLYPHRPCNYNQPKCCKSCVCTFQADGQPMGDECLQALRMEPSVLRLRKKHSLREAPQRQLDPRCYRRISPEFYSLLKSYEDGMNERYPLYGMPIRYWNRTTCCCPCEERRSKHPCEPCLGDQSLAGSRSVCKVEEDAVSEEMSDMEVMEDVENDEDNDCVDCDNEDCTNPKCQYNKRTCGPKDCTLTESNSTVQTDKESCDCNEVCNIPEKSTDLVDACEEMTCPALQQRKVLNSCPLQSTQCQKAIRMPNPTNDTMCVPDPKEPNELTCPNRGRPNDARTCPNQTIQIATPELKNSNLKPIWRSMESSLSKTVRIKCSKTNCAHRRGILSSFASMCKRAFKPGRHLLYNFGNGCPKTYPIRERSNEGGSLTPLFSHQPKACCWKLRRTDDSGESTAADCVATTCAAAVNVARSYAAATVAAAFPAVAPNPSATINLPAIPATNTSVVTSEAPIISIATTRAPKSHTPIKVAPTGVKLDNASTKMRPMAVINLSNLARQQSEETVRDLKIAPESPANLTVLKTPDTISQTNTSSTSSSANCMGLYGTLQSRVIQYLQAGYKEDAADTEEQSTLPSDAYKALLNASLKSTTPKIVERKGAAVNFSLPVDAKRTKDSARTIRTPDTSRYCSSRQYGPGSDYAQLMRLMARKRTKPKTSRAKSTSQRFEERRHGASSIGSNKSTTSSKRCSVLPHESRTVNRKCNGSGRTVHQPTFSRDCFLKVQGVRAAGISSAANVMGQFYKKFGNNFSSGSRINKLYDRSISSQVFTDLQSLNKENDRKRSKYLAYQQQESTRSSDSSNTTTQSSMYTTEHTSDQATSQQDELSVGNPKTEMAGTSSTMFKQNTSKVQPKGPKHREMRHRLTGNFIRPLKPFGSTSNGVWLTSSATLGKSESKESRKRSVTVDQNDEDNVPSCSNQKQLKNFTSQTMVINSESSGSQPNIILPMQISPGSATSSDSIECQRERIRTVTSFSNSSLLADSSPTKSILKANLQKPEPVTRNQLLINKALEKKMSRTLKYYLPHLRPQSTMRIRRQPSRRVDQHSADLADHWTRSEKLMHQSELSKRLSLIKRETHNNRKSKKETKQWSGPSSEVGTSRSCSGCDTQFNSDPTVSNGSNVTYQTSGSMTETLNSVSSHILHVFAPGSDPMAASKTKKRSYKTTNGYAAPCSSACMIKREYDPGTQQKLSQKSQTDLTCMKPYQFELQKYVPYEDTRSCGCYTNHSEEQPKLKAIYRRNLFNNAQMEILESSKEFPTNENLYEKHAQAMKLSMSQPIAKPRKYRGDGANRTNGSIGMDRPIQGANVFANTFDKLPTSRKNFVAGQSMAAFSDSYGYPPQTRRLDSSSQDKSSRTEELDQKIYQQNRYAPKRSNTIQPSSILKTSSKQLKGLAKSQNDVRRVNFVSQPASRLSLISNSPPPRVQHNQNKSANNVDKSFCRPSDVRSATHTVLEHNDNQMIPEMSKNFSFLNDNFKRKAATADVIRTRDVQILTQAVPAPSLFSVPTTTTRQDVIYSKSSKPYNGLTRLPVHIKDPNDHDQRTIDEVNRLPMNSQLLTVNKCKPLAPSASVNRRSMPPPVSLVSELDFNMHLMHERTINPNELRQSGGTSPTALTTLMNKLRAENGKASSTSSASHLPHVTASTTTGADFCTRAERGLKRLPCTPNNGYVYNNYGLYRRSGLRRFPVDPLIIAPTHGGLREQQVRQSNLSMLLYGRQRQKD